LRLLPKSQPKGYLFKIEFHPIARISFSRLSNEYFLP
jgi:hypothetical protein